ncbi:MAG: serine protease [Candidatus Azobacteroides sp.]|nr:serine protease [Candidatus Azobacteroides sp.]
MKKTNLVKPLITALLFLLLSTNSYSQKVTPNPQVDSDCSTETAVMKITSVITDKNYTLVTFQFVTTLFKPWISLDSKTSLKVNRSNSKFEVLEWGIVTDDGNEPFNALQFDEQYQIKRRIAYNFYMVFPAIPETATSISIEESINGSFYWRGIHINNETTEDLSKNKPDYQRKGEFTPSGSGSGFAISSDGYIATCYHVIADARAIQVKGVNGNFETALNAKVFATDVQNDLAILKVDDARFSQLPYSLATQLSDVGENIFVLGYPLTQNLGEELKLTTGVISSRSGYRGDITTYQISAQALPGNSGCPLFDDEGNVIGVVSAKYIEPNVSYAVKLIYLRSLIENSKISLKQPVSNAISRKSLADKVKSIRNFVYIIEVEK